MAHCSRRGDEMLVGDLSHMHVYEQGGSAQVSEATSGDFLPSSTLNQLCMYFFYLNSWLVCTPPP